MRGGAKMARVKVTGYLDLEDGQEDESSPTGLTEDAFVSIVHNEDGRSPRISDLEDVDTEPE